MVLRNAIDQPVAGRAAAERMKRGSEAVDDVPQLIVRFAAADVRALPHATAAKDAPVLSQEHAPLGQGVRDDVGE